MKGLGSTDPSHKVRSEFLAALWFAHLMTDEQIDKMIDRKLEEIEGFLKLIDEFPDCNCDSVPKGAQFVAGFGRHMALQFRKYVEANRAMLVDEAEKTTRAAVG